MRQYNSTEAEDIHILLVGDGQKRAELEQRCHEAKLTNISFLGSIA